MQNQDSRAKTDFTETETLLNPVKNSKLGNFLRPALIILAIAIIFVLALSSAPKNQDLNSLRDERTIIGSKTAKNHYIMMTDVMCPYCNIFSRLALENEEKFQKYLNDHDIVFEVRVTDFLYENNMDKRGFSRMGAEAIACATDQNRFWDYYHQVVRRLWQDYQSKGIGSSKNAPPITDLTSDYWLSIAKEAQLDDSFNSCFSEHKMLDMVKQNTEDATRLMTRLGLGGMPSFKFGKFTTSGFDTSWGYDYIERYLEAGLQE